MTQVFAEFHNSNSNLQIGIGGIILCLEPKEARRVLVFGSDLKSKVNLFKTSNRVGVVTKSHPCGFKTEWLFHVEQNIPISHSIVQNYIR